MPLTFAPTCWRKGFIELLYLCGMKIHQKPKHTVYIYDKEKASEQRHSQGLEMEEYRRKLADEAMTDDSMMAGF